MKRVAIVQSNYIPWKGYFDMIAAVDEFILYDCVQYTNRDWRNRNRIKTPKGLEWITVPVGQHTRRKINDVTICDNHWQYKHWKTFNLNYAKAAHYHTIAKLLEPHYLKYTYTNLSNLNKSLIECICNYLEIETKITDAQEYRLIDGKSERLVDLCLQAGAEEYISGPAAKDYLDTSFFENHGIKVSWFDYSDYPNYPQLWGEFKHEVSILDLLFNCGKEAPNYMKYVKS